MIKKILILAACLLSFTGAAEAFSLSPSNTYNTGNFNYQFNQGVGVAFGSYPNAGIYYDGTNLVVDILHGGGTVSFPAGLSGAFSPTGMMTFASGAAVTSTAYQMGRDTASPNKLHLNVPTGSAAIISVNGVTKATIDTSGVTSTFIGNLTGNVTGNVTGNATGALNGVLGGVTPAAATVTTLAATNYTGSGTIKTTNATGAGAHKLSGANTACNTTCASGGCLFGFDLAGGADAPVMVECADATADTCLCLQ